MPYLIEFDIDSSIEIQHSACHLIMTGTYRCTLTPVVGGNSKLELATVPTKEEPEQEFPSRFENRDPDEND